MGAIQNSLNQITNSVSSAVKTAAVIGEYGEHQKEQHSFAEQQLHEAKAEKSELVNQQSEAKTQWGNAEADLAILEAKKPGGKGNTKQGLEEKKKAKMTEIEAAEKAFTELTDKIAAKNAMIARAEKIMQHTAKWGGMR